jgi:hypothetical protein
MQGQFIGAGPGHAAQFVNAGPDDVADDAPTILRVIAALGLNS